jgi:calcineurin-like phosphoesterase family protein
VNKNCFAENYHIADTHFGHEQIIKLCNRPFKSAKEINEQLIEN